jgi:disulfide bond formation protein DsbB
MTMPPSLRAERAAQFAGGVALALIAGALYFQYFIHIVPCEMCHWQRWPLIAAAILGLAILPFARGKARALARLVIALVAVSGLIGAYQTGMQAGFLPGPQACTVAHAYVMGSSAPPPEISCNAVTWSLFGLSLAAYNAIISLATAAMAAFVLVKK